MMFWGCGATKPSIQNLSTNQKWNEQYETCRGKGHLISKGNISGKLSFSFTCTGKNVFIHFKDMLGRRKMMLMCGISFRICVTQKRVYLCDSPFLKS